MRTLRAEIFVAFIVILLLLSGCGRKAGNFSLSLSSGGLFVDQGSNGSVSIRVTRSNGFTKKIALSLTGAPAGVNARFEPNPVTEDASVLTLAAANDAPVGTYPLKIAGNSGSLSSTVNLKLTIVLNTGSAVGVRYVFKVSGTDQMDQHHLSEVINQIVSIMERRINEYGIKNVEVKSVGSGRIAVKVFRKLNNTEGLQIRRLLGSTGEIEFLRIVKTGNGPNVDLIPTSPTQEVLKDRSGVPYVVEAKPLLTSSSIANAAIEQAADGAPYIRLAFTKDGAELFSKIVSDLTVNDHVAIVVDNVIYSVRRITEPLKEAARESWENVQSCALISNGFNMDDAELLALIIRNGAFPTPVMVVAETPF